MKLKNLAIISVFTALTIAGAQIYIPAGSVPITLQVLFVLISGLILKEKYGFIAQLSYVLMGLMGLPVFAGFKGGIVHVIGPTGGYIASFPIAAWIVGRISKNRNFIKYSIASVTGVIIIYIFGAAWLGIYTGSFKTALFAGVIPFIPWDILKAVIASYVAYKYGLYLEYNIQKIL
ncbi:MAG: biotin transporter BioY [Thermotogaceae bacterium]|nr:biotin transporter BioY [Thermotogaceae bacterium]